MSKKQGKNIATILKLIAMHSTDTRHNRKQLFASTLKTLVILLLLGFSLWLIWIYYVRGTIDLQTTEFKLEATPADSATPIEVERDTSQHFHNLDQVVLQGIPYRSTCLQCHGDYPHSKTKKVRAFFNAHSWFMACEVCHVRANENETMAYRWLDHRTDNQKLTIQGKAGNYGARIVPILLKDGVEIRVDHLLDEANVNEYLRTRDTLDSDQRDIALKDIHKVMSKEPIFCDECHTENGILDFRKLSYSENSAAHLVSLDMGSMIKSYDVFHLPTIFDPKR